MRYFQGLRLKGIVFLKDAYIDLSYEGITIIRGRNLNVKKGMIKTNGVGKTVLLSGLADLVVSSHPLDGKSRGLRSSLFTEDDSRITLDYKDDNGNWEIVKSAKGKTSAGFEISLDGKNQEVRTGPLSRAFLNDLFDVSEDEFYNTIYLDGRKLSPIQMGTATSRYDIMSNIFQLHIHDQIREEVGKMVKDLNKSKAQHDIRTSDFQSIEIKDVDDKRIDKLEDLVERLSDRQGELSEVQSRIREYKMQDDNRKAIVRICKKYDVKPTDDIKGIIKAKEKAKKERLRYKEHLRIRKEAEGENTKYEHLLSGAPDSVKSAGKKELRAMVESFSEFEKLLSKLEDKKPAKVDKCDKPEADLDSMRVEVKRLQTLVEHLSGHGSGLCEYCGSTLSKKECRARLQAGKKSLEKLEKDLPKVEKQWREYAEYKEFSKEYKEWKKSKGEIKTLKSNMAAIPVKLCKQLLDSSRVEVPVWEGATEFDIKGLEDLRELRTLLKSWKKLPKPSMTEEDISDALTKIKKKQLRVMNELPKLRAEKSVNDSNVKTKAKLEEQIKGLEEELEDMNILTILQKAYSKKGVKILILKHLARAISDNLNEYSHLLFAEPFQFKIDVDVNKFDILYRQSGKQPADVRHLSGAESRCFTLLLTLSLLPLIPSNRRFNILVLDEVESALDAAGFEMFRSQFLPILNSFIPHIIIMTPTLGNSYPNSREITVVKMGTVSVLEEQK